MPESTEVETLPAEIQKELLPPVYSRQLKLFGFIIWSDTRKLDEEAFFERVAGRLNGDMAKELLILKSRQQ